MYNHNVNSHACTSCTLILPLTDSGYYTTIQWEAFERENFFVCRSAQRKLLPNQNRSNVWVWHTQILWRFWNLSWVTLKVWISWSFLPRLYKLASYHHACYMPCWVTPIIYCWVAIHKSDWHVLTYEQSIHVGLINAIHDCNVDILNEQSVNINEPLRVTFFQTITARYCIPVTQHWCNSTNINYH